MTPGLFRQALIQDFDEIFMMGADIWADGASISDYLHCCRNSEKYARGVWYVLENSNGDLVSSLIVYELQKGIYGIGSISTVPDQRRQGYASLLIRQVLRKLETLSPKFLCFLYSDINPNFYERFGFYEVNHLAQRYKSTVCMVRGVVADSYGDKEQTPEYF